MFHQIWFSFVLPIIFVINLSCKMWCYGFEDRIVGGIETTFEQVPYLINLRLGGQFICGGSMLTPNCVLSAAHCVYGTVPSELSIHTGSSRLSEVAPVIRKVASVYTSPFFVPATLDMDVAILKLNESIELGRVRTINLCNTTPEDNSLVKITGWGLTNENEREPADQVRTTNVRVVPKRECIQSYLGKATLTSTMFCATVPGVKDSCSGDSGGPVVQNNAVCGIVSWGFGCARAEYPGVYTNVASLRVHSFIKRILSEHCSN